MSEHRPYVPAETTLRDLTIRSAIAGVVFGALFGSANAYLGLRVGLTISTSIPLAVMSVALFKLLGTVFRPTNILECNISQTGGSAASSIASGIIFTVPALYMWGYDPPLAKIAVLSMLGGVLGILFMIPLRSYLIVREHANLPYPEGTAAAQVLIAADEGGARARNVFIGLAVGGLYKILLSFRVWAGELSAHVPLLKKGEVGVDPLPALLGVGYILGYRIGAIMVAGGLLSSLALIPVIAHFGESLSSPLFPETNLTIAEMSAGQIWSRYIRYIGAGAVAFAGILAVIRSLPIMYSSLVDGLRGFTREGRAAAAAGVARTQRDLPMPIVIVGVTVVALVAAVSPYVLGVGASGLTRVVGAAMVVLFAFMFVTVSSRIVGLVGVTSNPTSGMTIVTLLGTSLLFVALGWTDKPAMATVLTIGTVVCVAASMAGDISQDLKCGYIIGATPFKQQSIEILGACAAAFAVAFAVDMLNTSYVLGSRELAAPQATLMKTVIEGVLQANLPWGLVLSGAALSLVAALLGIPALPFAVGIYLPLSAMAPVFLGGCLRALVEWDARRKGQNVERRADKGVLLGSGLIAGEGLMAVAFAAYLVLTDRKASEIPELLGGPWNQVVALAAFVLLGWFMFTLTRPSAADAAAKAE